MLSLLSARLVSRRVPVAAGFFQTFARPQFKLVSSSLTRSFLTSALRADPSKTVVKPKTTTKPKPKPKSIKSKKPAKKVAKKAIKPKPKKVAKPEKLTIPRSIKIPPFGASDFVYFVRVYYNPGLPKITTETFLKRPREAATAWHALSADEKQKINREASEEREAAFKVRRAYLKALDPSILKELNRRRVQRGATRLHRQREAHEKPPISGYLRYAEEYRKEHGSESSNPRELMKKIGNSWMALTPEQQEVYNRQYHAELAKWKKSHP